MPLRRLLVLTALLGVVLVVAVGASHATVGGTRCPDRVWSSALEGLTDRDPDPCAAQSQQRVYAVAGGLMGLVLISGLLSRRD